MGGFTVYKWREHKGVDKDHDLKQERSCSTCLGWVGGVLYKMDGIFLMTRQSCRGRDSRGRQSFKKGKDKCGNGPCLPLLDTENEFQLHARVNQSPCQGILVQQQEGNKKGLLLVFTKP